MEQRKTPYSSIEARGVAALGVNSAPVLLSRLDLRCRYARIGPKRNGPSDATFWRWERAALLVPRRFERSVGYLWEDVWQFEGGQPPADMLGAYRAPLLGIKDVAALTPKSPNAIERLARNGDLPSRQVGRVRLFVPAEVHSWLQVWV